MKKMADNFEAEDSNRIETLANLKWVYGINLLTNPPIQYASNKHSEMKYKEADEIPRLIYTCGSAVIIFNPNTNTQSYYLEHRVSN